MNTYQPTVTAMAIIFTTVTLGVAAHPTIKLNQTMPGTNSSPSIPTRMVGTARVLM